MDHQRPINLDLGRLQYPPMAVVSILHRISGVLLFLLLPIMLYFFQLSLHSASSFDHLCIIFGSSYSKWVVWLFSAALIYHILAGIRHMLMDMGYGETLSAGRQSAVSVLILAVILIILSGVWIW